MKAAVSLSQRHDETEFVPAPLTIEAHGRVTLLLLLLYTTNRFTERDRRVKTNRSAVTGWMYNYVL